MPSQDRFPLRSIADRLEISVRMGQWQGRAVTHLGEARVRLGVGAARGVAGRVADVVPLGLFVLSLVVGSWSLQYSVAQRNVSERVRND